MVSLNLLAVALVVTVAFTEVRSQTTPCHFGWKYFEGSCYLFPEQKANWPDSEAYCLSFRSYLTEIATAEENTFIVATLKDYASKGSSDEGYWIGGEDLEVEGHFTWSRSNTNLTFTDFAPGMPDDQGDEDCLEIRTGFKYRWNDLPCDDEQRFICEMPAKEMPSGGDLVIG